MSRKDDYWRKFERGVEWFFPRQSTPAQPTPTQPTPPRPAPEAPTEAFRASLRDLESRIGASLSLAALTESKPPTVDGRYVIRRILGRGASGVVVEALDDRLHRPVALKLYAEPSERIVREGRALAKLDHPHVLRVFDVGEGTLHTDGDTLPCTYLSMELIEGESLRRWIETKDRSDADVRRVLREAGAGLVAAHASGLVHRDFKPENVMLDNAGRARVVDFGLASGGERADGDPMLTIAGTASYMAPEQHRGEATPASDVYAFARVCVELLTGALPMSTRGVRSVLASLPPALENHLSAALSPSPAKRPSLSDLVDALRDRRTPWLRYVFVAAFLVYLVGFSSTRETVIQWADSLTAMPATTHPAQGTWKLRTEVTNHAPSDPHEDSLVGWKADYDLTIHEVRCRTDSSCFALGTLVKTRMIRPNGRPARVQQTTAEVRVSLSRDALNTWWATFHAHLADAERTRGRYVFTVQVTPETRGTFMQLQSNGVGLQAAGVVTSPPPERNPLDP